MLAIPGSMASAISGITMNRVLRVEVAGSPLVQGNLNSGFTLNGGGKVSSLRTNSPPRHLQGISDITMDIQRLAGGNTGPCPLQTQRRRRNTRLVCQSSLGNEKDDGLVELPLFPLPLVLFPGAMLPLQIFEYRYRILMHTLLHTDLRFGVVYSGKETGGSSAVGCVGEVIKHEKLPDDRFFLVCRGQERFRVVDIVRSRPYVVAKVEWLEDRPSAVLDQDPVVKDDEVIKKSELELLADEVETLMKDVIRLSNKMGGKAEQEVPADLRKSAFPTPFSFWVASTFEGAPSEQQALLELQDTSERLRRERDTLRNTLNYLTAATAVKDAFSTSSE